MWTVRKFSFEVQRKADIGILGSKCIPPSSSRTGQSFSVSITPVPTYSPVLLPFHSLSLREDVLCASTATCACCRYMSDIIPCDMSGPKETQQILIKTLTPNEKEWRAALNAHRGEVVSRVLGCNLPLPSHGSSLRTAFQNVWDPPRLLAFFLKQCLDLRGEKENIRKTWLSLAGSELSRPPQQLSGALATWLYSARQCLTLLFQLIDVSHDGSEKGPLIGVIVHAAGHKVSQLLTRWCHWSAPALVESLFL